MAKIQSKAGKSLREFKTAQDRREFLQKELQTDLSHIGNFTFTESEAVGRNIENLIGAAQIPLGIAGPLAINGDYAKGEYVIPLATTEGALVASVSRGCKAVTESGGVQVWTENTGMTRGPVFYTGSLEKTRKFYKWVTTHEQLLKENAENTSSHLTFKKMKITRLSDYVFLRFSFDTTDAMGMNMVTIATDNMVALIEKETGIKCVSVAGNFDIDKKPAWMNFINNRGHVVWAEATLKEEILSGIVKTTAEKLFTVWLSKCMLGSAVSGSLGFNAHYANIIAAMFIATGQDAAHVVEGSMGITTAKVLPHGDLYFSIYLPSLLIGTVGGGTKLATQKEALEIMNIKGNGDVKKFAEIIGGAVLAGELSLLASLAEGTLAKAHRDLGRKGN